MALFGLIIVIIVAGCVLPWRDGSPSVTASPAPTLKPTVTLYKPPVLIKSTMVSFQNIEVNFDRKSDSQFENFTVTLVNTGKMPAVGLEIRVNLSDSQRGYHYYFERLILGDLPAGGSRTINITTSPHVPTYTIFLSLEAYWGDPQEFTNRFLRAYTIV